jgi:ubiquinone/menaquinone biosynthesis C-methylase UbiE
VLREIGLRPGQSVLDFGCGCGTHTIPAARLVGNNDGTVYALDRAWHGMWPGEGLAELADRVRAEGLANIRVMKTSGEPAIDLPDESMDAVLAHDVLHSYYFSPEQIATALEELHRVLKRGGFFSLYPGDPDASGDAAQVRRILEMVLETGFSLGSEHETQVVHENSIVRGHIWRFRKTPAGD